MSDAADCCRQVVSSQQLEDRAALADSALDAEEVTVLDTLLSQQEAQQLKKTQHWQQAVLAAQQARVRPPHS